MTDETEYGPRSVYPKTTVYIKNPTVAYSVFDKGTKNNGDMVVYLELHDETSGQSAGIEIPDVDDLVATIMLLEEAVVSLNAATANGIDFIIEEMGHEVYDTSTITTEDIDWMDDE